MEAGRGRLRLRRAWAGCAFLAWACLALDLEQNCSRTQYQAHRKCCSRCPPGQRVSVPCNESSDTVCLPCQAQSFQGSWTKQTECIPHGYCDQNAGLVVYIQGSPTQNVVCRCQDGSHCSSPECQSCRENKACGPGEGVEQTATHMNDTICRTCPAGFFSNISSATAPCQLWSSCGATGLVHKANGTPSSDVTCEEAQKARSGTLVLAAVTAVIVLLGGVGLLLWLRRRRRRQEFLKRGPQDEGCVRQEPAEADDEELCPALPVQETGPRTHEEDKESHLPQQEQA